MTKEEALKKYDSSWWEDASDREVVEFQLYEDRLCMDMGDFQMALERELGRSVWTSELASPRHLKEEFERACAKDQAPRVGVK